MRWNNLVADYADDEIYNAKFASEEYTPYFMDKFSYSQGLEYGSTDLSFLTGITFRNMIELRAIYVRDIIESGDYTKINMAIDEIIVLTKPIEK